MRLRVLFFSALKDVVGGGAFEREVASDGGAVTVADLLESLYGEWPALRPWDAKLLVAADLDYVGRDAVLQDGQEIAIMPPVQGG
ncbi:hypothetical protein BH23VER1_BH23VER1_08880 [soil metagenome]